MGARKLLCGLAKGEDAPQGEEEQKTPRRRDRKSLATAARTNCSIGEGELVRLCIGCFGTDETEFDWQFHTIQQSVIRKLCKTSLPVSGYYFGYKKVKRVFLREAQGERVVVIDCFLL